MVASSLAYTTILSIIPLLAVSFAIFHAFGGLDKLYNVLAPMVLSNLAEGTGDEVTKTLHQFVSNAHANAIGIGGLIGLIATSMSMLSSVEKAINKTWHTPVNRTLFQRISAYWLFITLGPLTFAVAVGVATSAEFPLAKLLPGGNGIFILTIGMFFLVYRWVPCCRVNWRYALASATVTSILLNLARVGYNLYTKEVMTYSKIYGSLGAVPILLLWVYILWIIILSGAALTAAMQRKHAGTR